MGLSLMHPFLVWRIVCILEFSNLIFINRATVLPVSFRTEFNFHANYNFEFISIIEILVSRIYVALMPFNLKIKFNLIEISSLAQNNT